MRCCLIPVSLLLELFHDGDGPKSFPPVSLAVRNGRISSHYSIQTKENNPNEFLRLATTNVTCENTLKVNNQKDDPDIRNSNYYINHNATELIEFPLP